MELGILDHLLVSILFLWFPLYAVWETRRFLSKPDSELAAARVSGYRWTIGIQWSLTALALVSWLTAGRSITSLGLGLEPGTAGWIGIGITLAACVYFVHQAGAAVGNPDELAKLREQLGGSLSKMMPHDAREQREFSALSITAGICEEILYRGFLIAYLSTFMSAWVAVVLGAVAFGVAHSYQGFRMVPKIVAIGLVMGGLYLWTGSLWAPMLLHAVVDLTSGYQVRRALQTPPATVSA